MAFDQLSLMFTEAELEDETKDQTKRPGAAMAKWFGGKN